MLNINLIISSIFVFLFVQQISAFGLPKEFGSKGLDYKSWKELTTRGYYFAHLYNQININLSKFIFFSSIQWNKLCFL